MVRNGMDNPWRAHHGLSMPPKYMQKKKKKKKEKKIQFSNKIVSGLGIAVRGLWDWRKLIP